MIALRNTGGRVVFGSCVERLAAVFCVLLSASCGGAGDYVPPPSPKASPGTVAFMGDSITALWNLSIYDSSPTLNFGRSGDNTEQMLARFHNQVIDSHPAVVVILGGVNDFQERGQAGTNTDAIRAMAAEAQDAGIKVILCSVLPTDYPNPNLNLQEIESFNQELVQLAQENGYLYADYYDVMVNEDGTTNDSLFKDHIHPNADGYAVMWAVISPLLSEDLHTLSPVGTTRSLGCLGIESFCLVNVALAMPISRRSDSQLPWNNVVSKPDLIDRGHDPVNPSRSL